MICIYNRNENITNRWWDLHWQQYFKKCLISGTLKLLFYCQRARLNYLGKTEWRGRVPVGNRLIWSFILTIYNLKKNICTTVYMGGAFTVAARATENLLLQVFFGSWLFSCPSPVLSMLCAQIFKVSYS